MQNEKGHTTTYRNVAFSEWLRHFAINTLYPSDYLTITTQGYTKYYYAGGTRIASRLGSGGFEKMTRLCTLDQNMTYNANSLFYGVVARIGEDMPQESVSYPCPTYYNDMAFEVSLPDLNFGPNFGITAQQNVLQAFRQNYANEETYYFHGNHLGSANWVTLQNASPTQFLLHLPYGEEFVKQLSGTYDERFTFTGKEKDIETGYYYHGARFNSSDIGWLSVDPMADKYPEITPYHYCHWNPIKLVDPDGRDVWKVSDDGKVERSSSGGGKHTQTILFSNGNTKKLKGSKYYKIMSDLSSINKDNISSSYGTEDMQTAFAQTFKLMADNTNVEWIMERYSDNHYALGTKHDKMNSPSTYNLSKGKQQNNNVVALIHSHPMVTGFSDPTSINEQISTMGYLQKSKGIITGDAYIKRNDMRKTFYYTYFPRTKQLWVVGINRPAFIRNIDSFRDFFFGTYNSR